MKKENGCHPIAINPAEVRFLPLSKKNQAN